jgi:acetolactate synthase-1/2/3 large subunit
MLLMSGRTPVTEEGRFGSRTVPIGWGQEMRDQTALVREASKWDYELKFPEQIVPLLDRAYAIANSTPKGPTYLSLPRETLCETIDASLLQKRVMQSPVQLDGHQKDIAMLAKMIAEAERPLIIAQRGAGDQNSFDIFAQMLAKWSIPLCSWWATHLSLPTNHPCHIGAEPDAFLAEADLVIVLDCLAPWWPDKHNLNDKAKVVHLGPDPLFSRFPVRHFPCDLAIAGETKLLLPALSQALDAFAPDQEKVKARQASIKQYLAKRSASVPAAMTKEYVGQVLSDLLRGERFSVFSELGVPLSSLDLNQPKSWFQEPHSGGLGWSFPASLGAQLADPNRICVATMGDGSYIFSNPTACHQIAEALGLPVLILVLNNEEWGAVRQSVTGMYPDGAAARTNQMPLTALQPSPDFEKTASASRAWAKTVDDIKMLRPTLESALSHVKNEKTHALVNIKIEQV